MGTADLNLYVYPYAAMPHEVLPCGVEPCCWCATCFCVPHMHKSCTAYQRLLYFALHA